jgi:hypothetical protein
MLNKLIDRTINSAGEWNAQLFRELKGRLTSKNLILTLLMSIIAQVLLMMVFFAKLPVNPRPGQQLGYQDYCLNLNNSCSLDQVGQIITDWPHWWTDILSAISWVVSIVLVVGGVYFLSADLRKEETRGTLNFVRLSPQSAANVFIGKLLGVPILIYAAVASVLPLQLVAGVNQGFGVANTIAFDGLWLAITLLFYLGAMLLTIITPVMPIGVALLAWWLQSVVGMSMQLLISSTKNSSLFTQAQTQDTPSWFYLPVLSDVTNIMLFAIFSCGLMAYAMWRMLCRRYMNPNDTLVSKKQSYQLNAVLQAWLLGWAIPLSIATPHVSRDILGVVSFVDIVFGLVLISTIIPHRDILQEWCRQTDLRFNKGFARWWPDLIWDDRSPAVVALAINCGMAVTVWVLFGLLRPVPFEVLRLAGLMLLIILNCGVATQLGAAYKLPGYLHRSKVVIIFLLQILFLSIVNSAMAYQFADVKFWAAMAIECLVLPVLMGLLWKRLQRLGRSETQEMFKTA